MKLGAILLAILAISIVGWLKPDRAGAVSGACATCHVMHASQLGAAITEVPVGGGAAAAIAPQDFLMRYTCLGCHTGTNDGASTHAPYVYNAANPGADTLSGGSFYYSSTLATIRKGHNPKELGVTDASFLNHDPPGWDNTFNANGAIGPIKNNVPATQLSCAGVYGCHGLHTASGVNGAHHGNVTGQMTAVDGLTLVKSYRFLNGIKGGEDDDYEYETTVDHNAYAGAARAATAADDTAGGTNTISYFCAECHGIFHSGAGTAGLSNGTLGSPWIRHPVDFSMSTSNEYAGYTAYNPSVPVATSTGTGDLTTTTVATSLTAATDRIVMCLSCHRAHGSPYDAALRWDPTLVSAGPASAADSTVGCFACHTFKDDGD